MKKLALSFGVLAFSFLPACKGGEAVKKSQEWADAVCACKDLDCAQKIAKEQADWVAKNGDAFAGSESDAEKVAEATKKMTDCLQKLTVK